MKNINLMFNASTANDYQMVNVTVGEDGKIHCSVTGKNKEKLKEMYDIISRIPTVLYPELFKDSE